MKIAIVLLLLNIVFIQGVMSQTTDSIKFDYNKIYGFALDGNISPIFPLLEYHADKKISKSNLTFKQEYENRFKYETDKSKYLLEKQSSINSLLLIFRDYWRQSLLDSKNNYDSLFTKKYRSFLEEIFPGLSEKEIREDSSDLYLKKYLKGKNLFTTD